MGTFVNIQRLRCGGPLIVGPDWFSSPYTSTETTGQMETILDHPWELGLLLAIVLALVLELGRRISARYRLNEDAARKDQMATIRDDLFVLASLLWDSHWR